MKIKLRRHILILLFFIAPAFFLYPQERELLPVTFWAQTVKAFYFSEKYPCFFEISPSELENIPAKEFLPWTIQQRVSGYALTKYGLVIGVNAGPPLLFSTAESGKTSFIPPDPGTASRFIELSRGLTERIAYCTEDQVFFHNYVDDLFSDEAESKGAEHREGDPAAGNYLLSIDLTEEGFSEIDRPDFGFIDGSPEWQPVEMIYRNNETLVAWKYSDDKKTRFRYVRHNQSGEAYTEINESYFRDEYRLKPIEESSFELRGFLRAVRTGSAGSGLEEAGDVFLKMSTALPNEDFPVFYHADNTTGIRDALPVQLSACRDEDRLFVLSDNEVLLCREDIRRMKLPQLPPGFKYRRIWASGKDMIISWEESMFPYSARAGMMHITMRDIINDR